MLLHGACADDRHSPEHIGELEAQAGRAVSAHAEAVEEATLARGDGVIGRVNVRHEVLDDHRLQRRGAVLPVDVHPLDQAVDEHHQAWRRLARRDGFVEMPGDLRDARKSAARTVQPVDDREAPVPARGRVVRRGGVEVVADLGLGRCAVECVERHARGLDLACDPLDGGGSRRRRCGIRFGLAHAQSTCGREHDGEQKGPDPCHGMCHVSAQLGGSEETRSFIGHKSGCRSESATTLPCCSNTPPLPASCRHVLQLVPPNEPL